MMENALLSAEDKHFFQHLGFDPMGIVRAAYVDVKQRRGARRLDHHAAVGEDLAGSGADLAPQNSGDDDYAVSGAEADQRADFRVLRELGLPGQRRELQHQWIWRGIAGLFRQRSEADYAARGRDAGRADQFARAQQPVLLPRQGQGAPQRGAEGDAGKRADHPKGIRRCLGGPNEGNARAANRRTRRSSSIW